MRGFIIFMLLFIGNLTIAQNTEYRDPYLSDTSFAKYRSTYTTDTIFVKGNQLHWSSRNESGVLPYEIEQYLWGRWTKIGEVMGKGIEWIEK